MKFNNESILENSDLDNYKQNGVYFYTYPISPSIKNAPFKNIGTSIFVIRLQPNHVYQIGIDRSASSLKYIAIRDFMDTGWSAWKHFTLFDTFQL